MRFVIDAFGISKPGGTRSSVLSQLLSVLALDGDNSYTVIVDSKEESLARFPNVEQVVVRIPNRLAAHLGAQVIVPAVAGLRKARLVHHTKNLCAAANPCATVVTVHDMATFRLPWTQPRIDVAYWKSVERFMVRRAKLVLTPSEDAKRDIVDCYRVGPNDVRVIPWAATASFSVNCDTRADDNIRNTYGVAGRYVLFVGILALKKNLPTLVRAFRILKREKSYDGKLVIVGREYPQSPERSVRALVRELSLESEVIFTGPVPDEHLPAFYRRAEVFAFPSLHEGFGIVLLEAMACGTPVVASASSSLPEVVGDAGLLVKDLVGDRSWADAIHEALSNDGLHESLVRKGLERASEFSWEKVGQATLESYLSVVRGR